MRTCKLLRTLSYLGLVLELIEPYRLVTVSSVTLTQPGITWERGLNEGLSRVGWPVREYLDYVNKFCKRPTH